MTAPKTQSHGLSAQPRRDFLKAIAAVATSAAIPAQLSGERLKPQSAPFSDFVNVAQSAGLKDTFFYGEAAQATYITEIMGGGCAFFDYDNDGWLDIYLANGSTEAAMEGKAPAPHAALFHNNHDGTFTDVAAKAGVFNDRWGFGAGVGEYDNDGWPDLYVSD